MNKLSNSDMVVDLLIALLLIASLQFADSLRIIDIELDNPQVGGQPTCCL